MKNFAYLTPINRLFFAGFLTSFTAMAIKQMKKNGDCVTEVNSEIRSPFLYEENFLRWRKGT